jgi:hypothetical protein
MSFILKSLRSKNKRIFFFLSKNIFEHHPESDRKIILLLKSILSPCDSPSDKPEVSRELFVWFLDSNCTDSGTYGGDGKWVSLGPMGIIGMARDTQTDTLTHSGGEDGQRYTLLLNTSRHAVI